MQRCRAGGGRRREGRVLHAAASRTRVLLVERVQRARRMLVLLLLWQPGNTTWGCGRAHARAAHAACVHATHALPHPTHAHPPPDPHSAADTHPIHSCTPTHTHPTHAHAPTLPHAPTHPTHPHTHPIHAHPASTVCACSARVRAQPTTDSTASVRGA